MKNNSDVIATALLLALGIAWLIVFPPRYWKWFRNDTRREARQSSVNGMLGRVTLNLTDETMTAVYALGTHSAKWRNMMGVDEVGGCLYIYTGLTATAIVPRHGFDLEADYFAVRDFVMHKLRPPS